MFGVNDEALIEGLEKVRSRLCGYFGETCDCKFGASFSGEQTGCPEIRQAIKYIQNQRDQVTVLEMSLENSAKNTLRDIKAVLDKFDRPR